VEMVDSRMMRLAFDKRHSRKQEARYDDSQQASVFT
jgi:hypothetical protein